MGKTPSAMRRLAAECLVAGDLAGVEKWCRQVLKVQPQDAEAWYLLGCAAMQAGRADVAQSCLQESATLAPARADYLTQLACSYSMGWRHPEAAIWARKALALKPTDAVILNTLGEILMRADEPAEALPLFEQAVSMQGDVAELRLNLASACRVLGDLETARLACEAALDIDARCHRGWSMLAELNPKALADERFDAVRAAFSAAAADGVEAQLHVGFALSRALETREEFAKAFDALNESKAAARRVLNYSFADDARLFDALKELFDTPASGIAGDRSDPASDHGDGCDSAQPIFVMGMPRTGTTLLDRMLSGHPDVESVGEVHNFGILLQRAVGDSGLGVPTPAQLQKALSVDLKTVAERYLESVAERANGASRFVDKLPHNFLFAGFISMALPRAKMLCLRRNPMDTCLGNFRQLFALSFPYYRYAYDIDDTARYYIAFHKLMAHWQTTLPGRILEVNYENLVREPEVQLRRVLEFCNLNWDPACLNVAENTSPVTTASAVQVREGINTRAIGRWRKYAPQLESVMAALQDAGIDIPPVD